jgi:hypothetical protein
MGSTMHLKAYGNKKFYPGNIKNREIYFVTRSFISEIYILNNKKFKWRYYYYGPENQVDLPKYPA